MVFDLGKAMRKKEEFESARLMDFDFRQRVRATRLMARALGTGKKNEDGTLQGFDVKVGDRVLISKYGGSEIKIDGKEYKLLNSDDLLAIVG